MKLFVRSPGITALGVAEYVWKNCCIGAKISACGSLLQAAPIVWSCCFCAFTGSGFPAASHRKGSRTKPAPDALVEYGLKIWRRKLGFVLVKSPAISAAVGA